MSNHQNVVITNGTSSSPPFNVGWQCPGCGKCYAPGCSECRTCGKDETEQEPVTDIPQFEFNPPATNIPCPHLFTVPSTSGNICSQCGQLVSPPPFTVTWGGSGQITGTTVNLPNVTIMGTTMSVAEPSLGDVFDADD